MRRTTHVRKVLLIGLIVILSASPIGTVSAGINVWTSNGPEGGQISALAIDPTKPTTLRTGTYGGGVFSIQQVDVISRTWHVAIDGSDSTGDGSAPKPFATIQHGIDVAANGDTVLVHPGIYRETIDFAGKNITVGSLFVTTGDEGYVHQTVIDGDRQGHVVTFQNGEAATARLSGFTIANGYAYGTSRPAFDGGGITCYGANPTLTHLKVSGNEAVNVGGGLHFAHCSSTVKDVMVTNNLAGYGGGGIRYSYGSVSLENVVVAHNASRGGGGGIDFYHADGSITNALIADNSGRTKGGGMHFDGCSPAFVNVTVVGNWTAGQGGGLNVSYMSQPTLVNSIVWGNSPQQIYFDTDWPGEAVTIEHSDVQGGEAGIATNGQGPVYWGDGNVDASPRFVDVGLGNYHLADDSPCICAGRAAGAPITDIEGNARPSPAGSNPDMGAHENLQGLPLATAPASAAIGGPTSGVSGVTYAFTASVGPLTTTTPLTYTWQATGQSPVTATAGLTHTAAFSWSVIGEKIITVTAANAAGIVSDTHVIRIDDVSPGGVLISGPAVGVMRTAYTFTATVNPPTTTTPLTYTWTPAPKDGQGTAVATYAWLTVGDKLIAVTAENVAGTVSGIHVIAIQEPHPIYLPLVLR